MGSNDREGGGRTKVKQLSQLGEAGAVPRNREVIMGVGRQTNERRPKMKDVVLRAALGILTLYRK